jgi:type I restriction enzyme M protein
MPNSDIENKLWHAVDDSDFKERLKDLNEELEVQNVEASEMEEKIADNVAKLLDI